MRVHVRGYEALLVLVFAVHVVLVPPTKVEESFTLHAARDLVVHGIDPQQLGQVRRLAETVDRTLLTLLLRSLTTSSSPAPCRDRLLLRSRCRRWRRFLCDGQRPAGGSTLGWMSR